MAYELGGAHEGVRGFQVRGEIALAHQRTRYPAAAADRDRRQWGQHQNPADRHLARVAHRAQRQEAHDHALVHQHERARVRQAVLHIDADKAELVGPVELREDKAVAAWQQFPEIDDAADLQYPGNKDAQPGDQQDNALRQVRHNDRGLAACEHVERDQNARYGGSCKHRPAQDGVERFAQRQQVDAHIAHQVQQDKDGGHHARARAETPLEILRHRLDALVVDDRQPDQYQHRHPEPVVEVGLCAAESVLVTDPAVLDKAVAADRRRNARERDQPPRKALPAEEEILGRTRVASEIQAEAHDSREIGDHDPEIELRTQLHVNHWAAPPPT